MSKPQSADQAIRLARSHARKGEIVQARQIYQALLKKFPGNKKAIDGLKTLSGLSAHPGKANDGQERIRTVIDLYNNGRFDEALSQGTVLAKQYPNDPNLLNVLGAVHQGLGRTDEAFTLYQKSLEISPGNAMTHNWLGIILNQLGRHEEALEYYRNALMLKPDYYEAHQNLGAAFSYLGMNEHAVACYRKALEINPDSTVALINLGMVLNNLDQSEEAIACFHRALKITPGDGRLHCNLGKVLAKTGRYEEAIKSYNQAVNIDAENIEARGALLHLYRLICDWEQINNRIQKDIELIEYGCTHRNTEIPGPFGLLALVDNPGFHRRVSEAYSAVKYETHQVPALQQERDDTDRIRIGYFSADFHNHATMYLMAELFEKHDRKKFEIHAFSFGPDKKDEMRSRLQHGVEYFHDVRLTGNPEIAALARSMGIDIAVDLKGYTEHSRAAIFSYRAAPIQVNYLGFPGTMGASFIDYIIADRVLIPPEYQEFYTEKVVYLPHSYQVNDSSREISDKVMSRTDLGLPEQGFVFCCFNNNYKITSDEFAIWMRLLAAVEGSVLWLIRDNELAESNLHRAASAHGIDPQRLVFADRMPLPEHLARHRLADLFLDTFIYNAHTTASDALWAGLPVLTKLGQGFASRVGGSLLTAVDMPDLVTTTVEDYEQRALELATQPQQLAEIRGRLGRNLKSAPLFDTTLFAKHIEAAYTRIYERMQAGQEPESVHVED